MKLHLLILLVFPIAAWTQNNHDVVILAGKITDQNSDSLRIRSRTFSRTIQVGNEGIFRDTFQITPGLYNLNDGSESTTIFLRNGFDLFLTLDTKEFDETITYAGNGAEHNNFLARKSLLEEKLLDFEALSELEDLNVLEEKMADIGRQLNAFYTSDSSIDTLVSQSAISGLQPMLDSYSKYLKAAITLKTDLPKGSPSPSFANYENVDGTTTSLDDLKGKYIYVDVWATWCGPCKAEIPALKNLEKEYHDRNIQFVSMSIDDDRTHSGSWDKAREDWKAMIREKELSGIQLFAPEGWKSDFVTAYKIQGIPRFILIDPHGNIVTPDAPRPSSAKLKELFDSLKI